MLGKNVVGFDFGESRIKMVLSDGKSVKKSVFIETPDNIIEDGRILSMVAMADLILQGAKENSVPRGNAAFILPSRAVFTRTVSMPVMNHQQVLYNLPYEFADYLTQEKGLYYFDYMILGTEADENGNPKEMKVFACAVLKAVINDYRKMFKRAGFKLKTAVPVEYAYSRLLSGFIEKSGIQSDEDYCIADIGHSETRVYIYHGTEHIQTRHIEYGLRGIDRAIAENMNVDEHIAQTYKLSDFNGVLQKSYCNDYYNSLAVEVMKTVNFYNYNNRDAELKKIYLAGGGPSIKAIEENIREMTGLPTESAAIFLPGGDRIENGEIYLAACGSGI